MLSAGNTQVIRASGRLFPLIGLPSYFAADSPLLDLSRHRLAVHKKSERKNGHLYTERRVLLPTDAELPGESSTGTPETADVHG